MHVPIPLAGPRPGCMLRPALLAMTLILSGCSQSQNVALESAVADTSEADVAAPQPTVIVTEDIRQGIEQHIEEKVAEGNGYFTVPYEGRELKLNLVRVHVEYLATLAPQRHFACVDMVSSKGEFYDIDFFLEGDAGDMTVTETSVHKLNGVPFYVWKQKDDGTWVHAPVEKASDELLGILRGEDEFEFRYQATLPDIDAPARCWIPLASSGDSQKVDVLTIKVPGKHRILIDRDHKNRVIYLELGPQHSGAQLEIIYHVVRQEKGPYPGDPEKAKRYLQPERMVPSADRLRITAQNAVAGLDGEIMRARGLYDHVIGTMDYKKFGEGWGQGDALYACNALYGNCTDYHAYFIGLARAVDIPARFAIGATIPSQRNEGGTDGYHCWAEFYADGKWYPVDISEADKFSALSMYFFGHHPANRFEFSQGRDLVLEPGPESGPINFLAYPFLEIDGVPTRVKTLFLFDRIRAAERQARR